MRGSIKKKCSIFQLLSTLAPKKRASFRKAKVISIFCHRYSVSPFRNGIYTHRESGCLNGGGRNPYPRKAHGSFRFKTKLIGASNDRYYFIVTPF